MAEYTLKQYDESKGSSIKPIKVLPIKGKQKIELYPTYMVARVLYGSRVEAFEITYTDIACYENLPLYGPDYYKLYAESLYSILSTSTGCDLFAEIEKATGVHIPSLEEFLEKKFGKKGNLLYKTDKSGRMTFSTLWLYESFIYHEASIINHATGWDKVLGILVDYCDEDSIDIHFLIEYADGKYCTLAEKVVNKKDMQSILTIAKKCILAARSEYYLILNGESEIVRRPLTKAPKCQGERIIVGGGGGEITDLTLRENDFSLNSLFLGGDLRKTQSLDMPYSNVSALNLIKTEIFYVHEIYEIKMTYRDGTAETLIRISGEDGRDIATKLFAALEEKIKAQSKGAKIKMGKI